MSLSTASDTQGTSYAKYDSLCSTNPLHSNSCTYPLSFPLLMPNSRTPPRISTISSVILPYTFLTCLFLNVEEWRGGGNPCFVTQTSLLNDFIPRNRHCSHPILSNTHDIFPSYELLGNFHAKIILPLISKSPF